MSLDTLIIIVLVIFAVLVGGLLLWAKVPKKLKTEYFQDKWKELQDLCRNKSTWPDALEVADNLLDEALKKRKFKGKTTGERLVAAQRLLSDNDAVWFAHNLYKKVIEGDPKLNLKESNVRDALVGFRQALRDLGALPGKNQNETSEAKK